METGKNPLWLLIIFRVVNPFYPPFYPPKGQISITDYLKMDYSVSWNHRIKQL